MIKKLFESEENNFWGILGGSVVAIFCAAMMGRLYYRYPWDHFPQNNWVIAGILTFAAWLLLNLAIASGNFPKVQKIVLLVLYNLWIPFTVISAIAGSDPNIINFGDLSAFCSYFILDQVLLLIADVVLTIWNLFF